VVTKLSAPFSIVRFPGIQFSTSVIDFGYVEVGTTARQLVTIVNSGTAALEVSKTDINGTNLVTISNGAPITLSPAQRHDLELEYSPTASEPLEGFLFLDHNAPGDTTSLQLIGDAIVVTSSGKPVAVRDLELFQSYPNPASVSGTGYSIATFDLPEADDVLITLYNGLGQRVRTVYDGFRIAGRHQVHIHISDLPAGSYVCRLSTRTSSRSRLLHIVK